jgi:putative addiction module component (TIGR02574 family)
MATRTFDHLASTVLALPTRQRARLAKALWKSLDDRANHPPVDPELLVEVKRRDQEISLGKVRCKTHEEVMKTARKALGC